MSTSIVPFIVHAEGRGVYQTIRAESPAGHSFAADAYAAFGGSDSAPSPLAYALASLSACNQVTASVVARDLGIRLGKWKLDVQADLDTRVLALGQQGNANFDRVQVRAVVETDASEDTFRKLVSETERRCPITQLFKRSGLVWDNVWTRAPLAEATQSATA
ncbi:MAG: OsmC family protein [Polyangiales bacterium]